MSLLLLSGLALATEVGKTELFGIGASTGWPGAISVTGKYYFNQKIGLAAFLGTSVVVSGLQAQVEGEFYEIKDWSWARLPLLWFAGVDLGITSYHNGRLDDGIYPHIGAYGGVGAALQFHSVPAEVFVQAGIALYPVNGCSGFAYGLCLANGVGRAGGRWYF